LGDKKRSVLIVDDDPRVCEVLTLYLEKEGMVVLTAEDGRECLEKFKRNKDDIGLIILDIMMPDINGWDVCRTLRSRGFMVPVLMLTAKTEDYDKILGLDLGADDYVEKPFNPVEVVSRVKAILRRTEIDPDKGRLISYPGLKIDTQRFEVMVEDKLVEMTPREVELLECLARHPGRVFSREQLLKEVWGYDYTGETRNIDVHIKHIRDKINTGRNDACCIETVWGVGYRFVEKEDREK